MDFIFLPLISKRLVFFLFVSCIAFAVHYHSANSQSYWCVWVTLMLSMIHLGDTIFKRIGILFFTSLVIMVGVFIAGLISSSNLLLAIFLSLVTVVSFWLAQRFVEYFFVIFIINLFVILSGSIPIGLVANLDRSVFIMLGTAIVIFFQFIFLYHFKEDELQNEIIIALRNLATLTKEIFACFLQLEYRDNLYLFEKRLHIPKTKFLQNMVRLRQINSASDQQIIPYMEQLFNCVMDCAQLRRRVSDYTLFELCNKELSEIEKTLGKIFLQMINKIRNKTYHNYLQELDRKIKNFEENYLNVLKVTAREPLFILLFVSSLKNLHAELALFDEDAFELRRQNTETTLKVDG